MKPKQIPQRRAFTPCVSKKGVDKHKRCAPH